MECELQECESKTLLKKVHELRTILLDSVTNIKSNDATFDLNSLSVVGPELRVMMQKYIQLGKKVDSSDKAFISTYKKLDGRKIDDDDQGIPNPQEYIDTLRKTKTAEFKKLKNFEADSERRLNELLNPPNEDIRIEDQSARQIPRDPITRLAIKNAVKSTVCHHVYDKDSIEGYIQQRVAANKPTVKCPQAGCTNKNMTRDELIPDDEINSIILNS